MQGRHDGGTDLRTTGTPTWTPGPVPGPVPHPREDGVDHVPAGRADAPQRSRSGTVRRTALATLVVAGLGGAAVLVGPRLLNGPDSGQLAEPAHHAVIAVDLAGGTGGPPTAAPTTPSGLTAVPAPTARPTPVPTRTAAPAPKPTRTAPTEKTPARSAVEVREDEVLRLVNIERAKAGCGRVVSNARLHAAARLHSVDQARHNTMSHTGSDGSSPWDRARRAGYNSAIGENVAMGYPTPQAVMNGWMNSPGHRANILNCSAKAIGVGLAYASGGAPYWTQLFGSV